MNALDPCPKCKTERPFRIVYDGLPRCCVCLTPLPSPAATPERGDPSSSAGSLSPRGDLFQPAAPASVAQHSGGSGGPGVAGRILTDSFGENIRPAPVESDWSRGDEGQD